MEMTSLPERSGSINFQVWKQGLLGWKQPFATVCLFVFALKTRRQETVMHHRVPAWQNIS